MVHRAESIRTGRELNIRRTCDGTASQKYLRGNRHDGAATAGAAVSGGGGVNWTSSCRYFNLIYPTLIRQ